MEHNQCQVLLLLPSGSQESFASTKEIESFLAFQNPTIFALFARQLASQGAKAVGYGEATKVVLLKKTDDECHFRL